MMNNNASISQSNAKDGFKPMNAISFKSFLYLMLFVQVHIYAQNAGIGTTTPVSKLEIRGIYLDPIVPGATSAGMIRLSAEPGDGIDIGKMQNPPYSGWIQAGFMGAPDPISLQPSGGNVGIGTTNPTNKLS